jgi:hypothetical protein
MLSSNFDPVAAKRVSSQDNKDEIKISEATTGSTVINVKNKNEILRLKKQRELFLNTKVYNENDEIIKMIDAKIGDLMRGGGADSNENRPV